MFQVNQAIEANIVRPELPEEADRVEQLLVRRVGRKQRNKETNKHWNFKLKTKSQVEFRAVQQRIHDLNQEMEVKITFTFERILKKISWSRKKGPNDWLQARISVAIEAVAADLRHIYVLTNTGDIMTFDFGDSRCHHHQVFRPWKKIVSEEQKKNLTTRIQSRIAVSCDI